MKIKNSYRLTFIPGMIVMMLVSSCSKDDSVELVTNQIVFDGQTYTMTGGVVEDYGPSNPADDSSNDTHYNYDFTIADATFVQSTDEFGDIEFNATGATFGVYVELFSNGTSDFQTGTFEFVAEENADAIAGIQGKNFFTSAEAYIFSGTTDTDGDQVFTEFEGTGGTVTVTGSGPADYTITYNLQFNGGKTLTGGYSGTFEFSDETDAD